MEQARAARVSAAGEVVEILPSGVMGMSLVPVGRKITKDVRADILYRFFIEQLVTYEQIRMRLARWGKEVGITSIREVLLENGLIREVNVFDDLVNPAELFHNEETDRQLRLDFDWKEEAAATEVRKIELLPPAGEKTKADVFGQAGAKPGRRMHLDQLKQGVYSAYAGGPPIHYQGSTADTVSIGRF